jgi:hypothetical protein
VPGVDFAIETTPGVEVKPNPYDISDIVIGDFIYLQRNGTVGKNSVDKNQQPYGRVLRVNPDGTADVSLMNRAYYPDGAVYTVRLGATEKPIGPQPWFTVYAGDIRIGLVADVGNGRFIKVMLPNHEYLEIDLARNIDLIFKDEIIRCTKNSEVGNTVKIASEIVATQPMQQRAIYRDYNTQLGTYKKFTEIKSASVGGLTIDNRRIGTTAPGVYETGEQDIIAIIDLDGHLTTIRMNPDELTCK